MKHITIILVDYNSHQDTLECLDSLNKIKAEKFDYQILIVDNGSQEVLKIPKKLQNERTKIIRSEPNLGFTGGNNLGIHYSIEHFNSDYVLLLNNDTIVEATFLEKMFACLEKNPELGMVNPKIYFYKNDEYHSKSYSSTERGNVLWFAGGSIDWQHLTAFHRGVDEVDRGQFEGQSETEFITGCAALIRREVLEKAGTLDKAYFLYLEDVDLSLRAQKAGYTTELCETAVVWHKNAGSSGGAGSRLHTYYQTRNRFFFSFKHGNLRVRVRALVSVLRTLLQGNQVEKRATFDFLIGKMGKQTIV